MLLTVCNKRRADWFVASSQISRDVRALGGAKKKKKKKKKNSQVEGNYVVQRGIMQISER